jgi:hypothetical protein
MTAAPNPRAIDPATIATIKALGFRIYQWHPGDSYLYFTDAEQIRIGYLENRFGMGLHLTTVHKPNTATGTGFAVGPLEALTRETLAAAFRAPAWASDRDRAASVRWKDWAEFSRRYPTYKEV